MTARWDSRNPRRQDEELLLLAAAALPAPPPDEPPDELADPFDEDVVADVVEPEDDSVFAGLLVVVLDELSEPDERESVR
ncbi:hypothetical protein GA0070620_3695 [Micromonospora krabiensis]|uniref:Uncharacterized protein n=1 Tax=Micromonospora krabiensis TaxID=307121 RepID=A0A1C3N6F9_9ACTN|nr:hypothetical protein GA0070620_3695 [Micromonospora krabiensis]